MQTPLHVLALYFSTAHCISHCLVRTVLRYSIHSTVIFYSTLLLESARTTRSTVELLRQRIVFRESYRFLQMFLAFFWYDARPGGVILQLIIYCTVFVPVPLHALQVMSYVRWLYCTVTHHIPQLVRIPVLVSTVLLSVDFYQFCTVRGELAQRYSLYSSTRYLLDVLHQRRLLEVPSYSTSCVKVNPSNGRKHNLKKIQRTMMISQG